MTERTNSLAALRYQATAGIDDLMAILRLAARLGITTADPSEVQPPFLKVGSFDVTGFAADSHRLNAAYRSVAEHLHRMPEQQIRLDRGWTGETGVRAVGAVVEHQRRAESDLHTLRTLADATGAASSGIDQLLRTWYVTVVRLTAPLIAGVPIAAVPEAIATGQVPMRIVSDDITARARLYFSSAKTTVAGIDEILEQLTRATDGMDVEPYPTDLRHGPDTVSAPHLSTTTDPVVPTERRLDATSNAAPGVAPAGAITEPAPDAGPTAPPPDDTVDDAPADEGRELDVPLRLGPSEPPASAEDASLATPQTRADQLDSSNAARSPGDLALAGEE